VDWLLEREDEEGFRRYLKSYGLAEGSEDYEKAFEAWRSQPRRPGAYAPGRSRRASPDASR